MGDDVVSSCLEITPKATVMDESVWKLCQEARIIEKYAAGACIL